MDNLRFVGVALGLFVAVFFGMKWLFTVEPLQPDARVPTFHRVDANDPRIKLMESSESDGDQTRDRLRHDVLDYAKALKDDPCNDRLKARYIEAVTNYAHAWLSIAPCFASLSCNNSNWKTIESAQHAFGSPLDARVRDAVQQVHRKVIFKSADFPSNTRTLVAALANDGTIDPRSAQGPIKGPVNADTPQPRTFESVRAQLGDTPQNVCGG